MNYISIKLCRKKRGRQMFNISVQVDNYGKKNTANKNDHFLPKIAIFIMPIATGKLNQYFRRPFKKMLSYFNHYNLWGRTLTGCILFNTLVISIKKYIPSNLSSLEEYTQKSVRSSYLWEVCLLSWFVSKCPVLKWLSDCPRDVNFRKIS